jgi:hypothetical protein
MLSGGRRRGRWPGSLALWLAAALLSGPLSAQRYGQWWWDGALGFSGRGTENLRDGEQTSDLEQQDARVSLGLNGFLVDPALGRFRLGFDLALTEVETGRSIDSERTGYEAEITGLPRGAYPFRLFYRRNIYDYSRTEDEALERPIGTIDTAEEWGGRLRLRRGPLKGTLIGVNRASFGFVAADVGEDVREREFVDWAGSFAGLGHHLRVEHSLRHHGTTDLEVEDLTVDLDQGGDLTETWHWRLSGVAIERDAAVGEGTFQSTSDYRLNTVLHKEVHERDQLDLVGDFSRTRLGVGRGVDRTGGTLRYHWRPREGVEVAPFVGYARQTAGNLDLSAPAAGVSASWTRRATAFDWLLGGRVSYAALESSDGGETRSESQVGSSFNASVGHGTEKRLRKEMEVEIGRNELRATGSDVLTDLPDLGVAGTPLGDEDFYRARLTLSHRWDSKWLTGWSESSGRQAASDLAESDFESETLTANLQFGSRSATIRASTGTTSVNRESSGDQEVRFESLSARVRPWRFLSLGGTFRRDRRDLSLARIDGERGELTINLQVGQIRLVGGLFESRERLMDGSERTNRGLHWSIVRSLAGWLPIVTGTQRRGVIR